MYYFLVTVHIIVSLSLIGAILLHSGKGGGLSGSFGGTMGGFSSSTVVEKNLDRITIILAVVFTLTSLILVFIF
ncbi:MAG: preprotein translocase subunit SecG [Actinomycetota bacterium]|nr:preprotein translocase subunit SecG [Actinomycetota bacterium]